MIPRGPRRLAGAPDAISQEFPMSLADIIGCAAILAPAALCLTLVFFGAFEDDRP